MISAHPGRASIEHFDSIVYYITSELKIIRRISMQRIYTSASAVINVCPVIEYRTRHKIPERRVFLFDSLAHRTVIRNAEKIAFTYSC